MAHGTDHEGPSVKIQKLKEIEARCMEIGVWDEFVERAAQNLLACYPGADIADICAQLVEAVFNQTLSTLLPARSSSPQGAVSEALTSLQMRAQVLVNLGYLSQEASEWVTTEKDKQMQKAYGMLQLRIGADPYWAFARWAVMSQEKTPEENAMIALFNEIYQTLYTTDFKTFLYEAQDYAGQLLIELGVAKDPLAADTDSPEWNAWYQAGMEALSAHYRMEGGASEEQETLKKSNRKALIEQYRAAVSASCSPEHIMCIIELNQAYYGAHSSSLLHDEAESPVCEALMALAVLCEQDFLAFLFEGNAAKHIGELYSFMLTEEFAHDSFSLYKTLSEHLSAQADSLSKRYQEDLLRRLKFEAEDFSALQKKYFPQLIDLVRQKRLSCKEILQCLEDDMDPAIIISNYTPAAQNSREDMGCPAQPYSDGVDEIKGDIPPVFSKDKSEIAEQIALIKSLREGGDLLDQESVLALLGVMGTPQDLTSRILECFFPSAKAPAHSAVPAEQIDLDALDEPAVSHVPTSISVIPLISESPAIRVMPRMPALRVIKSARPTAYVRIGAIDEGGGRSETILQAYETPGDGSCGYHALKITREGAAQRLQAHRKSVQPLLTPALLAYLQEGWGLLRMMRAEVSMNAIMASVETVNDESVYTIDAGKWEAFRKEFGAGCIQVKYPYFFPNEKLKFLFDDLLKLEPSHAGGISQKIKAINDELDAICEDKAAHSEIFFKNYIDAVVGDSGVWLPFDAGAGRLPGLLEGLAAVFHYEIRVWGFSHGDSSPREMGSASNNALQLLAWVKPEPIAGITGLPQVMNIRHINTAPNHFEFMEEQGAPLSEAVLEALWRREFSGSISIGHGQCPDASPKRSLSPLEGIYRSETKVPRTGRDDSSLTTPGN